MAPTGTAGLICLAWEEAGVSQVRRPAGACHPCNQRREMALTIVETRVITGGGGTPPHTPFAAPLGPIGGLLRARGSPGSPAGSARPVEWVTRVGAARHPAAAAVAELAALRPRPGSTVGYATRVSLRELGRRGQFLDGQLERLDELIAPLVTARAPGLLALYGIGTHTAALLLIAAGDHPERLRSEAAWAHLCAAAPIPASSGKTVRHRLNPGGDRHPWLRGAAHR